MRKFGFFDDKNREYVITTPETPYPWINYLGNDHFHSIISNTAGGYSFYKDPRLRRLTRYRYNNVPLDSGGKYFYIREKDLVMWSPGWKPVKTHLDFYECRHGLSYTQIRSELNGLACEVLYMVPLGVNAEIQRVKLTNNTAKIREFKFFSFVEWCLWNAQRRYDQFPTEFQHGRSGDEGFRYLPQNGIQRTSRPLCLLFGKRPFVRFRHRPGCHLWEFTMVSTGPMRYSRVSREIPSLTAGRP